MMNFSESIGFLELCWRYFFLGFVQGLTEFLPISSTAHLKVVPILLGWGDPGVSAKAVMQLGSLFAVLAYFWSDLKAIIRGLSLAVTQGNWSSPESRLGLALILGSLPICLAGFLIKSFWPGYATSFLRSIPAIACVSIVMALLLALAERSGSRFKNLKMVRGRDGLLIGLSQVFAIIPGVSRSGITLTASLFDGWERKDAARFSFLLGIPAIALAGLVNVQDVFQKTSFWEGFPLIVGVISSGVFSWFAIDWLLKYLQHKSARVFVMYRLCFGLILLVLMPHLLSN